MSVDDLPQNDLQLRSRFSELIFRGFLYLASVGLLVSLLRMRETGWQNVYAFFLLAAAAVWLLYFLRRRCSPRFVSLFQIGLTYAIGVASLLAHGLAANGLLWLSVGLLLIATQFSVRAALLASLVSILGIGLIGLAWIGGWLSFPVDANHYLVTPSAWVNAVIGSMPFVVLVGIGFAMLRQSTLQLLEETARQKGQIEQGHRELSSAIETQKSLARELEAILACSTVGVGLIKGGRLMRANPRLAAMLGYAPEELQQVPLRQLLGSWGRPASADQERQLLRKDGSPIWVRWQQRPLDPQRPDEGTVYFVEDISARRAAEQAIQESNAKLAETVERLQKRDHDARLLGQLGEYLLGSRDRREALQLFGDCCRLLLPQGGGFLALCEPGGDLLRVELCWGLGEGLEQGLAFSQGDCWGYRQGRAHFRHCQESFGGCRHPLPAGPAHSLCVPLAAADQLLGLACFVFPARLDGAALEAERQLAAAVSGVFRSGLANLYLREALTNDAIRDALTGLYNRRHMHERLGQMFARSRRQPGGDFALAILDIDHFKRLNDGHGHDAGDAVLRSLAQLLQEGLRESDCAFRLGGEEFVVLMPDTDAQGALACMDGLRQRWAELQLVHAGQALGPLSFSAGVALARGCANVDELLKCADTALYAAKGGGRNRVLLAPA